MHRICAIALAFLFAALPTLNDRCDLGCDRGRGSFPSARRWEKIPDPFFPGDCPLHQRQSADVPGQPSAPEPVKQDGCGHDHMSVRSAEIMRPVSLAAPLTIAWSTPAHHIFTSLAVFIQPLPSSLRQQRPQNSSRLAVLRI